MNRIPKPGEFYRDVENRLYQIVAIAEYTQTGETLVVYQALYGMYHRFAMPLLQFNRKADKKNYPRTDQEYWFEPVKFLPEKRGEKPSFLSKPFAEKSAAQEEEQEGFLDEEGDVFDELSFEDVSFEDSFDEFSGKDEGAEAGETMHIKNGGEAIAWLERFLDAEGYEKQLEVLAQMRGRVGKRELDSICLVLGIPASSGDEESQMLNIKKHLETRMRYDNRRLR